MAEKSDFLLRTMLLYDDAEDRQRKWDKWDCGIIRQESKEEKKEPLFDFDFAFGIDSER